MVYALGHVNFLSDPASRPCVTADQLGAAFGVAKSTMSSKARQVQRPGDLLRRAPGIPQLTNTVKQLLRWHKEYSARTGRAPWLARRGSVSSRAA